MPLSDILLAHYREGETGMRLSKEYYDVIIVDGGLAGYRAAIAAARGGTNTCLIQDRPVLGGNSSSEIRVTPHGAGCHHPYGAETGIVGEVTYAERAACPKGLRP